MIFFLLLTLFFFVPFINLCKVLRINRIYPSLYLSHGWWDLQKPNSIDVYFNVKGVEIHIRDSNTASNCNVEELEKVTLDCHMLVLSWVDLLKYFLFLFLFLFFGLSSSNQFTVPELEALLVPTGKRYNIGEIHRIIEAPSAD